MITLAYCGPCQDFTKRLPGSVHTQVDQVTTVGVRFHNTRDFRTLGTYELFKVH